VKTRVALTLATAQIGARQRGQWLFAALAFVAVESRNLATNSVPRATYLDGSQAAWLTALPSATHPFSWAVHPQ
jgi:hypothetical protein